MKPKFLAAALVVITALFSCNGCAEPEPVANEPVTENRSAESESRAPMTSNSSASSNSISSESQNRTDQAIAEPGPPKTELAASAGDVQPDAATSRSKSESGKPALEEEKPADVVSSKRPSSKKAFKLDFVSATGEEGLSPGDTIPNIKGKDIDGITFQLNDYKGKVIMLDFWGDW